MDDGAVRQIKERLDIVDVIGDYVRLHKTGKNFRGLCPFHQEKTPSFFVSPDRQTFHCFGCGEGGDIFSFVMKIEGLEFKEALDFLAQRAGIPLPACSMGGKVDKSKPSLYDIMERALSFFRASLKDVASGRLARQYLVSRQITPDAATLFEIGWAPSSWDSLWSKLQEEKVPFKEALDSGLVLEGRKKPYDRFRGRIMFPIRDVSGRLLAFGGRIIDGDGAKYINSPEGILYSKRQNLYLLYQAKQSVREKNRSILVEGYMDAIRLHLCGYTETVASLGTSLTEDQARLLKRFSNRCFICYDSDTAGIEATVRSMYVLQQNGVDVRVVELPKGKDPDDLLSQEEGKKLFQRSLDKALPLVLFHLTLRRTQLEQEETRRSAADDLLRGIAQLSPIDVAPYLPRISAVLGILPHELQEELDEIRSRNVQGNKEGQDRDSSFPIEKEKSIQKNEEIEPLEAALIYCLWNDSSLRQKIHPHDIFPLVESLPAKEVLAAVFSGHSPERLEEHWRDMGEDMPFSILAMGGAFCESFGEDQDSWEAVSSALERKRNEQKFQALHKKMLKGEATKEELALYWGIAKKLKKR
ncbi:DNA primase [Aminobacterium mobile]